MAKVIAALASTSVDPTQYTIGQGYLYTRQVYNFINNTLGNTLFYKSRVFKDANLIRNPLKRRYEDYDSAESMDGSPYIGERYNVFEKLGKQIVFLDDVSGLTGYTYNEGFSDSQNNKTKTNMKNAIEARGFNELVEDDTKPYHIYTPKVLPKVGVVGYPFEDSDLKIGVSVTNDIFLSRNSSNNKLEYFGRTFYQQKSGQPKDSSRNNVGSTYLLYNEKSDPLENGLDIGLASTNGTWDNYPEGTTIQPLDATRGLLSKTNQLFAEGKIGSLINRFHTKVLTDPTQFETANDATYGLSRGRNLRKGERSIHNGYDNPYCRVWTSHHQYSKVTDRIRPFSKDGGTFKSIEEIQENYGSGYRPFKGNERLSKMSSLQDNGYPLITPKLGSNGVIDKDTIKKCMFSIENLAWKDVNRDVGVNGAVGSVLSEEQKGPYGGRIMWFPPYNLKFTENIGVQWEGNTFLGRGEQIYTYTNTERSGTLDFTILVDHPSIVDSWANSLVNEDNVEKEQELLRFFAGCSELETETKKVPIYKPKDNRRLLPPPPVDPVPDPKEGFERRIYLFFPNNLSGQDYLDNPSVISEYMLNGYTGKTGGYEIGIDTSIGTPGPVNGCLNSETIVGKHRTYRYHVDDETINQYLRGTKDNNLDTVSYGLNSSFVSALSGTSVNGVTEVEAKKLKQMFELEEYPLENIINFTDFLNGELNNLITQEVREDYDISIVVVGNASSHGGKVSTAGGKFEYSEDGGKTWKQDEKYYENYNLAKRAHPGAVVRKAANGEQEDDNKRLSDTRAHYFMNLIKSTHVVDGENIYFGGNNTIQVESQSVNNVFAKAARSAEAIIIFTPRETAKPVTEREAEPEIIAENEHIEVDKNGNRYAVSTELVLEGYEESTNYNYDDEYAYFKKIGEEDSLIKKNIVKKVRYFDPAFHSITPEGFNARLTFLQQCTRQGPTYSAGDLHTGVRAGNLAFGRPPVCVLRIGDFYYTKIIIDSISINYDNGNGVQFDLNPEGIGIQPMMANITIGFKFLGGSDISGPISRLQNAVSSNFFANTSVYERKADYRDTFGGEDNKGYKAWNASFNNAINKQSNSEKNNNTEHIDFNG